MSQPLPPFVFFFGIVSIEIDESISVVEILFKQNPVIMSGNSRIGGHKIFEVAVMIETLVSETIESNISPFVSHKVAWSSGVVHVQCTIYTSVLMKIASAVVGQ